MHIEDISPDYLLQHGIVEIDGASHFSHEAYKKDQERDRQMRVIGLEIIRVLDGDVCKDADNVAAYIEDQCKIIRERMGSQS